MSNSELFLAWIIGFPLAGVVVGVAGLRFHGLRLVLAGIGPLYSIVLFAYGLFRGGPNDCTSQGAGYVCHPTAYLADLTWFGVLVVVVVTILGLAPLTSAWFATRAPSVVATVALAGLVALFLFGLLWWVPAASAVLAAAIAGPPMKRVRPAPMTA
jgi:hypothetical protein